MLLSQLSVPSDSTLLDLLLLLLLVLVLLILILSLPPLLTHAVAAQYDSNSDPRKRRKTRLRLI